MAPKVPSKSKPEGGIERKVATTGRVSKPPAKVMPQRTPNSIANPNEFTLLPPVSRAEDDEPASTYKAGRKIPPRTQDGDRKALIKAREAHTGTKKQRISDGVKHISATVPEYTEGLLEEYRPSTIPLRRIYDDGDSKSHIDENTGAVKKSWSSVGFPFDETLVVEDLEDQTHINMSNKNIIQLLNDLRDCQTKTTRGIADIDPDSHKVESADNRVIETFTLHGRTVTKAKFEDADVTKKNYSNVKRGRKLENAINKNKSCALKPSPKVVNYVTADIILRLNGEVSS